MEFKRRGTLMAPSKPVLLQFKCIVSEKMHMKNAKYYMALSLFPSTASRVSEIHKESAVHMNSKIIDPFVNGVLTVKIPFKYNKVTCKVSGQKTLQELVFGDNIEVLVEYCGVWAVNGYCGPSWKLTSCQ